MLTSSKQQAPRAAPQETASHDYPTSAVEYATLRQVSATQQGIPAKEFFSVVQQTGISQEKLASLLEVSPRTLNRYRREGKNLSAKESELLIKLSLLLKRGAEIFGTTEAFTVWLAEPAYGLDQQVPFELLFTSEGVNLVADEVERIAFGDLA